MSLSRLSDSIFPVTASGWSGVALWGAISQQGLMTWLAFAASVGTTAVGWWIARRSEIHHADIRDEADAREARRHQERLDAEERREQKLQDLIQLVVVRRCALDANEVPPSLAPEYPPGPSVAPPLRTP